MLIGASSCNKKCSSRAHGVGTMGLLEPQGRGLRKGVRTSQEVKGEPLSSVVHPRQAALGS